MKKNKEEFKCLIYDLMQGARNLDECTVKGSREIQNEFGNGMYCSEAYEQVHKANQGLCVKLNTDDDAGMECINSNLELIHLLKKVL